MEIAGEQLRMARLAFGFTLEALGEQVGATRQHLHLLETGARSPSEDLLMALCDVLAVTRGFLAAPMASTVRPEQCHFRGNITRPATVTSQVLARGTILDRLVAEIEKYVDLPVVDFPDYSVQSSEDIEQAAEAARDHWRLGSDTPILNVMRVVENAGALVTYFDDLSDRVDAFSMDRRRPIIVRSSLKDSLFRQRFDIAHELGHLIMHRGIQTGDRDTENQAHRFAGAFLFPRRSFLREFPRGQRINWSTIFALKMRWKISARAMIRRAYDLGLISAAQYRTANIYLVKSGQAKVEKFDDHQDNSVERPELMAAAVSALRDMRFGGIVGVGKDIGLEAKTVELLCGSEMGEPLPPSDTKVVNMSRYRS
jgi:Zn-dependent peptidase ImmA (M78 family)/DNA-binding XRE family transcriptional regulator